MLITLGSLIIRSAIDKCVFDLFRLRLGLTIFVLRAGMLGRRKTCSLIVHVVSKVFIRTFRVISGILHITKSRLLLVGT